MAKSSFDPRAAKQTPPAKPRFDRSWRRGAAITEMALMLPIFIVILLYSMYFTDLVRAKLKLQEASRYLAWEFTSYTLDDYGGENHAAAFNTAKLAALDEANLRYRDLDSVDDGPRGTFTMRFQNFQINATNDTVPAFDNPLPFNAGAAGPFVDDIVSGLSGGANFMFNRFKFNTTGQITTEVTVGLDNLILPRRYLDEGRGGFFQTDVFGGRNIQTLRIKNKYTLVASGWALPDGADAEQHSTTAGAPRSGVHKGGSDSGLYTQVSRMVLLGVAKDIQSIPGISDIMNILQRFMPNPLISTYVVSNNYVHGGNNRGCENNFDGHEGWPGMNNLEQESGSDGPGLDYERRKCWDTAPFRDTQAYDDSHYRTMFKARGEFFMGCKRAMADNPSEIGPPDYQDKDEHRQKVICE